MSLRELRKDKGLSQIELSEISGIRQSTLSQYETEQESLLWLKQRNWRMH